jgi:hypothetical protein
MINGIAATMGAVIVAAMIHESVTVAPHVIMAKMIVVMAPTMVVPPVIAVVAANRSDRRDAHAVVL